MMRIDRQLLQVAFHGIHFLTSFIFSSPLQRVVSFILRFQTGIRHIHSRHAFRSTQGNIIFKDDRVLKRGALMCTGRKKA